ncbi:hypothetical protein KGQ90_13535 [Modicisalibacter tunisiensis]|uniref:hypothetical protein n=1 Tax=Modicisalibacter tunisiensis TaxID=390637 RepID=UPI001CCF8D50|nr:hypothetical protein [Modicisalibacter tunisiensis]MBZ9539952.1 hypothetical protein [Modicisalibacter tunisiensis]
MDNHDGSPRHSVLIYLGAGANPSLEACIHMADTLWLVEGSRSQLARLEDATAGLANVHTELAVVDTVTRSTIFHDYNLTSLNGVHEPDEAMQRLYPGLRCLAREEREGIAVSELTDNILAALTLADTCDALLVIDLGAQTWDMLQTLAQGSQLLHFSGIAVVPPRRQAFMPEPLAALHGPVTPPFTLDWLADNAHYYTPHPLLPENSRYAAENQQLTQRLAALESHQEEQANQLHHLQQQRESHTQERDELQQQLKTRTQERDANIQAREEAEHTLEQARQSEQQALQQLTELTRERDEQASRLESLLQERDALKHQREALTQERDELWHKGETLTRERDEARHQVNELTRQREDALHQNHINHEALNEARQASVQLTEERDHLRQELQAARQQAERHHQQLQQEQWQRQQLVEQEMLKAEAQLDLVREILTHGKDF